MQVPDEKRCTIFVARLWIRDAAGAHRRHPNSITCLWTKLEVCRDNVSGTHSGPTRMHAQVGVTQADYDKRPPQHSLQCVADIIPEIKDVVENVEESEEYITLKESNLQLLSGRFSGSTPGPSLLLNSSSATSPLHHSSLPPPCTANLH